MAAPGSHEARSVRYRPECSHRGNRRRIRSPADHAEVALLSETRPRPRARPPGQAARTATMPLTMPLKPWIVFLAWPMWLRGDRKSWRFRGDFVEAPPRPPRLRVKTLWHEDTRPLSSQLGEHLTARFPLRARVGRELHEPGIAPNRIQHRIDVAHAAGGERADALVAPEPSGAFGFRD